MIFGYAIASRWFYLILVAASAWWLAQPLWAGSVGRRVQGVTRGKRPILYWLVVIQQAALLAGCVALAAGVNLLSILGQLARLPPILGFPIAQRWVYLLGALAGAWWLLWTVGTGSIEREDGGTPYLRDDCPPLFWFFVAVGAVATIVAMAWALGINIPGEPGLVVTGAAA